MANTDFIPELSTDYINRGEDLSVCLSDVLDGYDTAITALQNGKASTSHTHTQYVLTATVTALETTVNGKADASHNHDTVYAAINHAHSDLETAIADKAAANHNHDTVYATVNHAHTALETAISGKASSTHTHAQNDVSGLADALAGKANTSHTHSQSDITGLSDALSDKADASHTHTIANVDGLQTALNGKEASGAAATALANANAYTDTKISALVNSAPTTMDTLGEIAAAMEDNADVVEVLNAAIGTKANASHTHTLADVSDTTDYVRMTAAERTKLSGIATGANKTTVDSAMSATSTNPVQNKVVNTALGNKVDKVSGKGLSTNDYTTDEKNKLAGIAAGANAYTHPSYTAKSSGLYKVTVDATGHVSAATAVAKADITALGIPSTNTTYSAATTSANGLMTKEDKAKLDGIASGANAYSLPTATGSVLGGVKTGSNITNSSGTISLTKANVTSALGYTPPTTNTTYSVATTSANGLMSSSDKSKLDGIASGANNYSLPTASSTLGGVKTTSTVTSTSGLTACPIIGGVPYYKDTNTTYTLSSLGAAAASHTHDYLPLSGGTVDGDTTINGILRVNGQQSFYYQTSTASQTVGTNNATGGTTICCGSSANVSINGANLKTPTVIPKATNTYYCGNANFRWKGIYSSAAVNVSSDRRLKENIETIDKEEAVRLIGGIDVCEFNYIGDTEKQVGVIAQDIIANAPALSQLLVSEDENGYYGVKTSDLVFPLIAAVQALTKRVQELENR